MRKSLLTAVLLVCAAPSYAKDPIVIIENGVRTGYGQQGIIDFAKDYESNPRDLTLEVLGHPFVFDVGIGGVGNNCGTGCTSLNFRADEMGVNESFTGTDTADLIRQFKDFVKGERFLKPFMRLINSGPGGQLTGSPVTAVGATVRSQFQDVMFANIKTSEQRESKAPPLTDPQFSGGFAQFTTDGYGGKVVSFAPGFTLDFGAKKDQHLKISMPVARIDLEGLRTYRAGLTTQYLYPFYPSDGWTITVGPGLSYVTTFSADLPSFTGLMGGALSTSVQRDWEKYFAGAATYYGRFNNLGGIDAGIQANIYGWGAQGGVRYAKRWVSALQIVGMHERAAGFTPSTYHTVGVATTYKILNRFDLTFSINKMFGLPGQRFADLGLGSAWFF